MASSLTASSRHISHGFYKVTDREARLLARNAGAKLPAFGYGVGVELPDGRLAWLSRTPYRYYPDSPKREWVWAVSGIR